jgi:hypothetical protein
MKIVRHLIVVATAFAGLSGVAQAASVTLTTAPMLAGLYSQVPMECALTNASKDPVTARWQLVDLGGSVLAESDPIVVAPGGGIAGGAAVQRSAYCRFFVEGASKGDVAAAIHATDANGTTLAALPAP